MKKSLLIAFVLFSAFCYAQDVHYSQFMHSPLLLNAAETGNFMGDYRFTANQRTQWRSVSSPYSTFSLGAEARNLIPIENLSLGLFILSDKAGDSRLRTNRINISASYEKSISTDKKHSILAGLQTGITFRSIDYDELSFDNQYNGAAYDPNLPTQEDFARNSMVSPDLNLGVIYTFSESERQSYSAGIALNNLTQPDQSFYNDIGVKLPLRFTLHAAAVQKIKDNIDLLPAFSLNRQGSFTEFLLGTNLRYILLDERSIYRAVFIGYFGRLKDSGIAMAGFEYDTWRFGLSYDINLSDLDKASNNKGGFEFSLRYILGSPQLNQSFQHKFCPNLL